MKIFKNDQTEVEKATAELLRLKDEKYALLESKERAIRQGDGELAVNSERALQENKLRIVAAENALKLAKKAQMLKEAEELPDLQKEYSATWKLIAGKAAMYQELAAAAFSMVGLGHVALKILEATQPLYATSEITPDTLVNIRTAGKVMAKEFLHKDPLPDLRELKARIDLLKAVAGGSEHALESAWAKVINRALRESLTPEQLRERVELERRAANI